MPKLLPRQLLLLYAIQFASPIYGEAASFDQAVAPFFQEHCILCHGEKKQKGDFRLGELSRDFALVG